MAAGEATFIFMDTSLMVEVKHELFQNQFEGLRTYILTKIDSHPENIVGVIAMGEEGFGWIAQPNRDCRRIMRSVEAVPLGGDMQLVHALFEAGRSLYHFARMKRRVVVFAGGQLRRSKDVLQSFAEVYRFKSIPVDVIQFGSDSKDERLQAVVAEANNDDNSRFLHVPVGSSISDILLSDPTFITGVSMEEKETATESENKQDDAADAADTADKSVVDSCAGESVNVEVKDKRRKYRGRDKRPGKGRKCRGNASKTRVA